MPAPLNPVKAALRRGDRQIGLWLGLGSPVAAEIAGHAGFDWCLIDAEHGPNTLPEIAAQLRALAATPAVAAVRVPVGEDWVLKQVLDLGVQTIVVPLIHDAADAARAAAAVRYPPDGVRGMGAGVARATGYGRVTDYSTSANAEICLFVQAESARAVENIDAIAATEGIDGVFIGPADLSADMGHVDDMLHPDVVAAMDHVIERTLAAGKAVGTIWFSEAEVRTYLEKGVTFMGVGAEGVALNHALRDLAGRYAD